MLGRKGTAKDEQYIGNSDKSDRKSQTYVASARILVSLVVFLSQKNGLSVWFDTKCCVSGVWSQSEENAFKISIRFYTEPYGAKIPTFFHPLKMRLEIGEFFLRGGGGVLGAKQLPSIPLSPAGLQI